MTAPTENTGDEGLRHTKTTDKVLDIIDNGDSNRYAVALRISNWHDALIRQDRRELLALLLEQQKAAKIYYGAVGGTDVVMVVPVSVIDAELQHEAESGEA